MHDAQVQHPFQYYHQIHGTSSSTMAAVPYHYGCSLQAPRGTPQAQRMPVGPSYIYYPTSTQGSFTSFPSPTIQPKRHPLSSSNTFGTCLICWCVCLGVCVCVHAYLSAEKERKNLTPSDSLIHVRPEILNTRFDLGIHSYFYLHV